MKPKQLSALVTGARQTLSGHWLLTVKPETGRGVYGVRSSYEMPIGKRVTISGDGDQWQLV